MTPAQLRALLDADNGGWSAYLCVLPKSSRDAIVTAMNAADALHDLWSALRSTGYTYRHDSEDPVERRIADALRRLEELNP